MAVTIKRRCIICFDYWDIDSGVENIDSTSAKLLRNRNKFIFHNFCRYFQIPLSSLEWDFTREHLPFCKSCQGVAENLIRLQQQLVSIKNAIHNVEQLVKTTIVKASQKDDNVHKITSSHISEKEGKRVKFFQDLIVGPCLRVLKLKNLPSNFKSVKDFATLCSQKIKDEILSEEENNDWKEGEQVSIITETLLNQNVSEEEESENNEFFGDDDPMDFFDLGQETEQLPSRKNPRRLVNKKKVECVNLSDSDAEGGTLKKGKSGKSKRKQTKKKTKSQDTSCSLDCNEEKLGLTKEKFHASVNCDDAEETLSNQDLDMDVSEDNLEEDSNVDNTKTLAHNKRVTRPLKKTDSSSIEDSLSDSDSDESDEDYRDDFRDKDFILPDDAAATILEDSKLQRKIVSSLKSKIKKRISSTGDESSTKKIYRIIKKGDQKYEYGGFEFTGDSQEGYICSLCPQTNCKKFRGISQHIRQKHIDTNGQICSICGKILSSSSGLRKHLAIHKRLHGVICQYCGRSYSDDKGLDLHISLVHFPEYKHSCDCCGKKFRQISQVNKHKRAVHFKEKRFYCDRCSKGFFDSGALTMHLKSHSTDKPYACEFCNQRFNRQTHKRRHIKQFHELKVTDNSLQNKKLHSSTNYAKIASLRQSQPDIVGDDVAETILESLKCQYCGLQYNRQNNLTRHLLQIHHVNVKGLAWKSRRPPTSTNTNQKEKGRKKGNRQTISTEEEDVPGTEEVTEQEGESVEISAVEPPNSTTKNSLLLTLPNWANSDHPLQFEIPIIGERLNQVRRNSAWTNSATFSNPQLRLEAPSSASHSNQFPFGGSGFV